MAAYTARGPQACKLPPPCRPPCAVRPSEEKPGIGVSAWGILTLVQSMCHTKPLPQENPAIAQRLPAESISPKTLQLPGLQAVGHSAWGVYLLCTPDVIPVNGSCEICRSPAPALLFNVVDKAEGGLLGHTSGHVPTHLRVIREPRAATFLKCPSHGRKRRPGSAPNEDN